MYKNHAKYECNKASKGKECLLYAKMIRMKIRLILQLNCKSEQFSMYKKNYYFVLLEFFLRFPILSLFCPPGCTSPSRSGESRRGRGCCWLIRPTRPLSRVTSPSTKNWLWRWLPCSLRSHLTEEDTIPKNEYFCFDDVVCSVGLI